MSTEDWPPRLQVHANVNRGEFLRSWLSFYEPLCEGVQYCTTCSKTELHSSKLWQPKSLSWWQNRAREHELVGIEGKYSLKAGDELFEASVGECSFVFKHHHSTKVCPRLGTVLLGSILKIIFVDESWTICSRSEITITQNAAHHHTKLALSKQEAHFKAARRRR